jgi:hypothetical protein
MIITTYCSHIVIRLPTTICIMVPVRLQGKKTSKNTGGGCSIGLYYTCLAMCIGQEEALVLAKVGVYAS